VDELVVSDPHSPPNTGAPRESAVLPRVTVVTATMGRKSLARAMKSVVRAAQVLDLPVVHLLVVDGPECLPSVQATVAAQARAELVQVQILAVPLKTGRKGATCKAIGSLIARSTYVSYLDDDNWYRRDHLRKCTELLDRHPRVQWLHSGVWVVADESCEEPDENVAGLPDICESLGLLRSASYLPFENTSDTNCLVLRAEVARGVAYHWQKDLMRGTLVIDDRLAYWALLDLYPRHAFMFEPTVYYVPNSKSHFSVFESGNSRASQRVKKRVGTTLFFRPSRARVLLLKGLRELRNAFIRNFARRGMRWDA
jgi:hypothetical protein